MTIDDYYVIDASSYSQNSSSALCPVVHPLDTVYSTI